MESDRSLPRAAEGQRAVASRGFLLVVVFLAGIGTLGIEMVAPRLLAPFFGTSQPIWAAVIGLTLIYLSIGYQLGGRLADRRPEERLLFQLIAWAGFVTGFIPIVSYPILRFAQQSLKGLAAGGFLGALLAVLLLFAAPVILLAMVGPFAVRLQFARPGASVEKVGSTAGSISAISTVGSIVGTYLTVLVLIPWLGSTATTYLFAFFLMGVAIVGLRDWRYLALIAIVALLASVSAFVQRGIKAADCRNCRLVYEAESAYNYIQIAERDVEANGRVELQTYLILNEGQAIHSIYRTPFRQSDDPRDLLTGGPWDFFMAAPFVYPERGPTGVESMALLGSAAGTIPKQFLAVFGPETRIDAVEIDPSIVEVGRRFFDLEDLDPAFPNYTTYTQDARYWLAATPASARYDVIGMDAYHQPYIPFHLTTVEFFRQVEARLSERGVAVVNAGRPPSGDSRLVDALGTTMSAVFPEVYMIDTLSGGNTLLIGVKQPVGDGVANLAANADALEDSALRLVLEWSLTEGQARRFEPTVAGLTPFTDDHAPVERLIDGILFSEATRLAR
jgi:predicted membrane-bound spermidine synthase